MHRRAYYGVRRAPFGHFFMGWICIYKNAKNVEISIGATRKMGGSNWGYKPPLLTRASRRGFSLCSSLSVIATLAAPKGAYLANGSSYSFTLSLSTAISCFSWSLIYFLIVSSLRPTVLT